MENTIACCTAQVDTALLGTCSASSLLAFPLLLLDRGLLISFCLWLQSSRTLQTGQKHFFFRLYNSMDYSLGALPLAIQTRFHCSFCLDYLCFVTELGLRHPTHLWAQQACGKETQRMQFAGSWLCLLQVGIPYLQTLLLKPTHFWRSQG